MCCWLSPPGAVCASATSPRPAASRTSAGPERSGELSPPGGRPTAVGQLDGYAAPFTVGSPVHVTLYDPAARGVFGVERLHGKSVNSPYLGRELPGRVVATFHGGVPTVLDGMLRDREEVARG